MLVSFKYLRILPFLIFIRECLASDIERLRTLMGLDVAAYCEKITVNRQWICNECDPSYKLVSTFGNPHQRSLREALWSGISPVGFIAVNNAARDIVVSFKGSSDHLDFGIDATLIMSTLKFSDEVGMTSTSHLLPLLTLAREYLSTPQGTADAFSKSVKVHDGFIKSYNSGRRVVRREIAAAVSMFPTYDVTFSGHSLGGSMALLAALDFVISSQSPMQLAPHVSIITFGQPRVGNLDFARLVDSLPWKESLRITRRYDPIPRLPLKYRGYVHHKHEFFLLDNFNFKPSCTLTRDQGETSDCSTEDYSVDASTHSNGYFDLQLKTKDIFGC